MKKRLDQLLVEKGLADSRNKAQAMIMAGEVTVEGQIINKAGMQIADDKSVSIKEKPRYVSRAGNKLESVANKLNLNFKNKIVLDVGSSTGGFTDFSLQNGAQKVYAVDVGTGQLHWKLRQDKRVVVMEKTDIRDVRITDKEERSPSTVLRVKKENVERGQEVENVISGHNTSNARHPELVSGSTNKFTRILEASDIAVIDVSFISLRQVLPSVKKMIEPDGQIVAMAKPQFESDKPTADKNKGVIKNNTIRRKILKDLEDWFRQNGFVVEDKADSEVSGAKGNVERFYLLKISI